MLFGFHYPKIAGLLLSIAVAYLIFSNSNMGFLVSYIQSLGYLGIFIGGILFAFGFTSAFGVGIFLTSNIENIFLAAIIAGLGAMMSNLLLIGLIRISFMDEINRLEKTRAFKELKKDLGGSLHKKTKIHLAFVFAGLIIASPIPDEFATVILAGFTHLKTSILALMTFVLSVIGIAILLMI